jgi:hypothetical protein
MAYQFINHNKDKKRVKEVIVFVKTITDYMRQKMVQFTCIAG